jgi:hypothetical protein
VIGGVKGPNPFGFLPFGPTIADTIAEPWHEPYEKESQNRMSMSVTPQQAGAIGFVYAEEHSDANWCYYSGQTATTTKKGVTKKFNICDSAAWSAQQFVDHHNAAK